MLPNLREFEKEAVRDLKVLPCRFHQHHALPATTRAWTKRTCLQSARELDSPKSRLQKGREAAFHNGGAGVSKKPCCEAIPRFACSSNQGFTQASPNLGLGSLSPFTYLPSWSEAQLGDIRIFGALDTLEGDRDSASLWLHRSTADRRVL